MDYGKFKYQEQKKAHDAVVVVVGARAELDFGVKLRNATRFLEDGDRVKVTLRFRGREMAHQELGMRVLERIKSDLEEFGQVEQMPKMEGRQAVMMLAPKKKK